MDPAIPTSEPSSFLLHQMAFHYVHFQHTRKHYKAHFAEEDQGLGDQAPSSMSHSRSGRASLYTWGCLMTKHCLNHITPPLSPPLCLDERPTRHQPDASETVEWLSPPTPPPATQKTF